MIKPAHADGYVGDIMDNNDILRRFRYALDLRDSTMVKIFTSGNCRVDAERLKDLLKREGDPGFVACGDTALCGFLDGLIALNRGPREGENPPVAKLPRPLTNNLILTKLKIALELRQEDLMEIFSLAGVKVSKGELSALFRKEGHKNYRPCQDQFLRNFLKGLAVRHRK